MYGVEWSWFAGRNLRRFVTSLGERDVGGLCMEEAPGRVERGLQQITEVKILEVLVGDIAFAEWKIVSSILHSFCRI